MPGQVEVAPWCSARQVPLWPPPLCAERLELEMRLPRQVAPWLLALERTVQELELELGLELPLQSLVQVTLCSSTCRSWERHHWQARQRVMAL